MSTTIVMPQLGESVAEGVIGKWLKQEGDRVERDEPIVEVITDKVNAEIPSPVAGVLEQITQPDGATVAVGQAIAEQPASQPRATATAAVEPSRADRVRSSPLVRRLADQYGINLAEVPG